MSWKWKAEEGCSWGLGAARSELEGGFGVSAACQIQRAKKVRRAPAEIRSANGTEGAGLRTDIKLHFTSHAALNFERVYCVSDCSEFLGEFWHRLE